MKKLVFTLLIVVFAINSIHAQAYEGKIEFDKKKQDAFVIDFPYPPEAAENALLAKMEKMGHRPKEEKGFLNKDKGFKVYKSIFISEASEERLDYLFKIERKSRKDKDEAIIYMVMQKHGSNLKPTMNAEHVDKAKSFLNNLRPNVEAAKLELDIKAQEDVIAKAEKKLKTLKDEQTDLETRLAKNKEDQLNTEKDISTQKTNLETLRTKRTPVH